MTEPTRIAFKLGGSKRPVISQITSSVTQFDPTLIQNEIQPEQITALYNGEIKSHTPTQTKTELVIPSQPNRHHELFRAKQLIKRTETPIDLAANSLDNEAKRALLIDAEKANEQWDGRTEDGSKRVEIIEQDAKNTFTSRFENPELTTEVEEEKLIEHPDYEAVPIEDFGMAVMRGMGYKDNQGLGISNQKQIDVFVPQTRPRGLGLGADRKILEKLNHLKRNAKKTGIDEKDDLCMEKGACVLITNGPHSDQYGTVESIDEDVTRLTVALAIGGTNKKKEIISISQYNVKLVTEKEFLKYSKYVNKSRAEQVEKETSDELMRNYHHQDDSKSHRSSKNDDDGRGDHYHHSKSHHHHRDRHESSKKSRRH